MVDFTKIDLEILHYIDKYINDFNYKKRLSVLLNVNYGNNQRLEEYTLLTNECVQSIRNNLSNKDHVVYLLLFQDFLLHRVKDIGTDSQDGFTDVIKQIKHKFTEISSKYSNDITVTKIKDFIKHFLETYFNISSSSLLVGFLELLVKLLEDELQ